MSGIGDILLNMKPRFLSLVSIRTVTNKEPSIHKKGQS